MVDIELPPHLSHSQSSNLLSEYCSAQYFFERGLGVPSRPGWAQIGGSALHEASEVWDRGVVERGEADSSPSTLEGLFGMALDIEIAKTKDKSPYPQSEWQASGRVALKVSQTGGPNKKDEGWWRAMGPLMLASWVSWRLTSSWEIADIPNLPAAIDINDAPGIWGIEVKVETELGGVPWLGYIDRVFEHNGEYLVVDLKSGREPDSTSQLGAYRTGLLRQYGIDARYGAYWLGGTGLTTSFTDLREKWPEERVDRRYATARRRQLAGEFDPKPSNMCGSCGVKDYCREYGGVKSADTPQPWEVGKVIIREPSRA